LVPHSNGLVEVGTVAQNVGDEDLLQLGREQRVAVEQLTELRVRTGPGCRRSGPKLNQLGQGPVVLLMQPRPGGAPENARFRRTEIAQHVLKRGLLFLHRSHRSVSHSSSSLSRFASRIISSQKRFVLGVLASLRSLRSSARNASGSSARKRWSSAIRLSRSAASKVDSRKIGRASCRERGWIRVVGE